ncbi:PREDICTED: 28S ribosomal protein S10, mitochondrial-like [Branchiostoma belcheri]|uniref:Small ribosomal subunit protein uS10m n=1 Tax=Branchiostoma belcheri TaxID=7741 RepID=A0A6P4Z0Q7_BRABE|nr:PREDICTED: 28S ribosomal protein S10, mitochondrial-like [Branchiostoma belcheri]
MGYILTSDTKMAAPIGSLAFRVSALLAGRSIAQRLACGTTKTVENHLRYFPKQAAPTTATAFQPTLRYSSSTSQLVETTDEPDVLYKRIVLLCKGHEEAVLDSYEQFVSMAAKELGLRLEKIHRPRRTYDRITLLKSVHVHKKHKVQYEIRTHYRVFHFKHLTGSTSNVFLEYVQRNLPEGVAMEVKKTALEKLPDELKPPETQSETAPVGTSQ